MKERVELDNGVIRTPFNHKHHCSHRHRSPDGYSRSETPAHTLGKKLVLEWLRSQPAVVEGTLKEEACLPGCGKRRPDIQAVVGDKLFVFEIQNATLPRSVWKARHIDTYADAGIRDIWFWKPNVTPNKYSLRRPLDMLVIDPCKGNIGVPVVQTSFTAMPTFLHDDCKQYTHPVLHNSSGYIRGRHILYSKIYEWELDPIEGMVPPQRIKELLSYEGTAVGSRLLNRWQ